MMRALFVLMCVGMSVSVAVGEETLTLAPLGVTVADFATKMHMVGSAEKTTTLGAAMADFASKMRVALADAAANLRGGSTEAAAAVVPADAAVTSGGTTVSQPALFCPSCSFPLLLKFMSWPYFTDHGEAVLGRCVHFVHQPALCLRRQWGLHSKCGELKFLQDDHHGFLRERRDFLRLVVHDERGCGDGFQDQHLRVGSHAARSECVHEAFDAYSQGWHVPVRRKPRVVRHGVPDSSGLQCFQHENEQELHHESRVCTTVSGGRPVGQFSFRRALQPSPGVVLLRGRPVVHRVRVENRGEQQDRRVERVEDYACCDVQCGPRLLLPSGLRARGVLRPLRLRVNATVQIGFYVHS